MTVAVEDQNYDKSERSFQDLILFLNKTKQTITYGITSVLEQLQSSTLFCI